MRMSSVMFWFIGFPGGCSRSSLGRTFDGDGRDGGQGKGNAEGFAEGDPFAEDGDDDRERDHRVEAGERRDDRGPSIAGEGLEDAVVAGGEAEPESRRTRVQVRGEASEGKGSRRARTRATGMKARRKNRVEDSPETWLVESFWKRRRRPEQDGQDSDGEGGTEEAGIVRDVEEVDGAEGEGDPGVLDGIELLAEEPDGEEDGDERVEGGEGDDGGGLGPGVRAGAKSARLPAAVRRPAANPSARPRVGFPTGAGRLARAMMRRTGSVPRVDQA